MTNTSTRAALGSSSPTPFICETAGECSDALLDADKSGDEDSVSSYVSSAPSSVCTPWKSAFSSPSPTKSLSRS